MSTSLLTAYARPREGIVRHTGIDALNDMSRASGVEFAQSGRGELEAEYRITSLSRVHFSTAVYSHGVVVRGTVPPGSCIVTVPTANGDASFPVGSVTGAECTFHPDGREFVQVLPARRRIVALVLDEAALQDAAQAYWGLPLRRIARCGIFHTRGAPWRSSLLARVDRLGALAASAEVEGPHGETLAGDVERELFDVLLGAALPDGTVNDPPDRQRLARKAASILRANLDAADGLTSVATLLRTTLRTLELGFREVYGMSPRAFRHLLRLQKAREDLRRATPYETVGQIAMRNGLLHLGRFSVSYRNAFGESPSETIRTSRGIAA